MFEVGVAMAEDVLANPVVEENLVDVVALDVNLVDVVPQYNLVAMAVPPIAPSLIAAAPSSDQNMPLVPPRFENVVIKVNNHSFAFNHCLNSMPVHCFRPIKYLLFNLDTILPSYVSDEDVLLYLTSIVFDPNEQAERSPRFIGPLPLPGPLVLYSDFEDDGVQVIPSFPPSTTSNAPNAVLREPLYVSFLRRSARLS